MTFPELLNVRSLFERVAPKSFLDSLCKRYQLDRRDGVYTPDVVAWLMIRQWLDGKGTLSAAVQARMEESPGVLSSSKRVREDRISSRTGAYCQARQNFPRQIALDVTDRVCGQLQELMQEGWKGLKRPVFLVDGTTLQLQHQPELVKGFPPGTNQHGKNHWPVLQMVAFHDVFSGVALRPSWGPMYGKRAVSEQSLAQEALQRLPSDAVVLGDTNFGIFAFAYAVHQSQRAMILRMQLSRARSLLGQEPVAGRERDLSWKPSPHERKAHPELPEGAQVEGRMLVFQHPCRPRELLCVFTTLDLPAAEILKMYGLRWNMELDLRSLKRTVGLHQLRSKSAEMVEKELLMAVSAYNLVRAAMCLAAQHSGLQPRQLSFSQAQDVVRAALPALQQAPSEEEFQRHLNRMLRRIAQCTLPERPQPRAYPREVWGQGAKFPRRRRSRKTH